ncbi:MAG: carbon-nitrogen hydrolase family protein [Fibrobacteres bacterium]|nr:carbon-nitrogen hydrolase family protein [Fibrobacterota bacterium]
MKTALIQLDVKSDKKKNIEHAETLLERAASKGAELIVLPEMFNCPYGIQYFKEYSESIPDGPTCRMLSSVAKKRKIIVVGGSMPEAQGGKLYNASPVFSSAGKLIAKHRKIHLFDINLKTVKMQESAVLTAGKEPTVFDTPIGKCGLIICYDVRFPELFRLMLKKGVKMVVMPGAFTVPTGEAHWHMLMKTRAVDNQVYMVAVSPARSRGEGYKAFGHSLVSDPFGQIVVEGGISQTTLFADIKSERIAEIRAMLPLLRHSRLKMPQS